MKLSSEKLVEARKRAGYTQPRLAEEVGIHVGTLRAFEQKRTNDMGAETVARIAHALDVPMESLFADEAAVA